MLKDEAPWGEQELEVLRGAVAADMSPKRYRHTAAVETMVARLCALYCPEKTNLLRAAALLHDITKECDLSAQMALCRELGIMLHEEDEFCYKTFHAKTAAALIPIKYPLFAHETVVEAVRWHTTGRERMTLTERLLYLADYIDDSRMFPDCVHLREFFWNVHPEDMTETDRLAHLRRTLILSFDMTMRGLINEDAIISPDSALARNQLILEELLANKNL